MHPRARADEGVLRAQRRRLRRVRQGGGRHADGRGGSAAPPARARRRPTGCRACAGSRTRSWPRSSPTSPGWPALHSPRHRHRRLRGRRPRHGGRPPCRRGRDPHRRSGGTRGRDTARTRGSSSTSGETLEADRVIVCAGLQSDRSGPRLGPGRRAADRPLPRRVLRADAGARPSGQGPHLSGPRSGAALPGRPSDAEVRRLGVARTQRGAGHGARGLSPRRGRVARALRDADAGPGRAG